MDLNKIPPNSRFILEKYLIPGNHGNAKLSALLLNLYMHVSQIMCFNRITVERNNMEKEFPMLYGMYFAGSGTYKDRPQEILDSLSKKIYDTQGDLKKQRYDALHDAMLFEAEKEKTPSAKAEYKKRNEIRWFKNTMNGGTYQGLQTDRMACQKYCFGHIHFKHSEFLDALKGTDPKIMDILSKAKEIYNKGDSMSETLKTQQINDHVTNVPFTMMIHGSIAELYENEALNARLKGLLNTGFAKRSFVIFSDSRARNILSYEEERNFLEVMQENKERCEQILFDVYKYSRFTNTFHPGHLDDDAPLLFRTMETPEETREMIHAYKNQCTEKANNLTEQAKQYDLYDRSWRAFRLAACIAMIEHPKNLTVTVQDYDYAIYLSELWGREFFAFLGNNGETEADKFYNHILDNPGTTKTELRNMIPRGNRMNSRYLEELMNQINDICVEKSQILQEMKGARNRTTYSIIDEPDHEEVEYDEFFGEDPIPVKYSEGETDALSELHYINKECDFNEFHNVTSGKTRYACCHFTKEKRSVANYDSHNLIIFDIDNDIPKELIKGLSQEEAYKKMENYKELDIETAKEMFSDFKCLIVPTKHHLIKKSGGKKPPKNRFRIILPTKDFHFNSTDHYKQIMENMCNDLGIEEFVDMKAAKDLQLPYGCHKGDYWYSEGTKIINWQVYDYKVEEKNTRYHSNRNFTVNNVTKRNVVDQVQIDTKDGIKDWKSFEYLSVDQSVPCKCPFGTHEDSNPSAFVSRHTNGSLFVSCSSCGETKFNK